MAWSCVCCENYQRGIWIVIFLVILPDYDWIDKSFTVQVEIIEIVLLTQFFDKERLTPSPDHHSDNFCNQIFSLNPREITSPNKSTFRQTVFFIDLYRLNCRRGALRRRRDHPDVGVWGRSFPTLVLHYPLKLAKRLNLYSKNNKINVGK